MPKIERIKLTTSEPGGPRRRAFPVTTGIPFAPGALAADQPIAIQTEAGQAQPLQTRVLETHHDGSIRWLLVDYQADLPPLAPATHVLTMGRQSPEPPADRAVRIREDGDTLVIENGVLELEIDRNRCVPPIAVRYRGELVSSGGLDITITGDDDTQYPARLGTDTRFSVDEPGPLRLLVRWDGTHRDKSGRAHFDFTVRLTVYAGQPFVRIDHVFFNRLDADVTPINKLVAHLPIRLGDNPTYRVGGRHRPGPPFPGPAVHPCDEPVRAEQLKLNHHRITTAAGKVLADVNANMAGFVNVSGDGRGVLLAGKWFWQNYPKAIGAGPDQLTCELIPQRDRPFDVPRGMAKNHTFFCCFHDGTHDDRALADTAYSLQRWPMPTATAQHYLHSGQVWDFFTYDPEQYPRLEAALRKFYPPDREDNTPQRQDGRAWGLKHYGDYVCNQGREAAGPDTPDTYYLNNEYDTAHVLAMLFLRQPDIIRWWGVEAHALHTLDIDTCHHALPRVTEKDPSLMRGCQYRHGYQHIGGLQSVDDPHAGAGLSHAFCEGINDFYHLTGDRRARDQVVTTARHLAEYTLHPNGYVWGLGRSLGWGLLVMGAAHRIEPDELVTKAADAMIDKTVAQQREAERIAGATMHPNEWMDRSINLAMRGLINWHQATGCGKTRGLILELMDLFTANCVGAEGLPAASNWPEASKPTNAVQGFANLEGLAYAYDLTGDRKYVDAGVGALCHAVEWILNHENDPATDQGEDRFMRMLRGPFRFMAIAHELGILQRVPNAGAWLLTESR